MNKKYIKIGMICGFLLISGICYSCAFRKENSSKVLTTSLAKEANSKKQDESNQNEVISASDTNIANLNPLKDTTKESTKKEGTIKEGSITDIPDSQVQVSNLTKAYIHICGAVNNPGVYSVATGARIYDLIELAGGLSKNAAGDYINQAEMVTDGQRIYIPTKEEVKDLTVAEYFEGDQKDSQKDNQKDNQSGNKDGDQSSLAKTDDALVLVDINTASEEILMKLPGIGQAKADSIIEYRTANGKFAKTEDLMKISGIKEGLFSKISSYIIAK